VKRRPETRFRAGALVLAGIDAERPRSGGERQDQDQQRPGEAQPEAERT
jgi:hypothetical protein